MEDLSSLERSRVKFYLVTDDNWFIYSNQNNDIEKVCQIDDASSFFSEYDVIKLSTRCKDLGIDCKVIKYSIKYQPIEELTVVNND